MKTTIKTLVLAVALGSLTTACEDFLDVRPEGFLLIDDALQTRDDLQELLNSAYDVTANVYGGRIQVFGELLADNLAKPFGNSAEFYNEIYIRRTNIFNSYVGEVYRDLGIINLRCNVLLENLDFINDAALTDAEKKRMSNEARFLRAMSHFDQVRYFGHPYGYTNANTQNGIVIKTNSNSELLARNSVAEVYQFVISELEAIDDELPTSNGNYATKWAAKALLARVYFQMNDYQKAAGYADEVIQSGLFILQSDIQRFTNNTGSETVFGTYSTVNGSVNDVRSGGFTGNYRWDNGSNPVLRLDPTFYSSLEAKTYDARIFPQDSNGTDLVYFNVQNAGSPDEYVAVSKFNANYFNVPLISLTEMKLTRAEALAYVGNDLSTAIQDINDIRARAYGAGTEDLPANATANEIIDAARYERRIELIGEGDRAQDMKRLGAGGFINTIRGANWNCNGMVLQFPSVERSDVFVLNEEGGC